MHTILVATEKPFARVAVDGIAAIAKEAGLEFRLLEKYPDKETLLKAVGDADALIVRSDIVDKAVIQAANKLKIVVRAGAGYDNIDLEAATAKSVVVMNTPGQNANAVAELTFGMMIYLNRNFFNGTSGVELRGKTLGLHAYGHVGRVIGLIGRGMGMDVFANDPYVEKIFIENDGVKYVPEKKDLYRTCQYVVVCLPASTETRESIDYTLMSSMPEGATLVNPARKEVIHEPSLLKIFAERKDFRYITDVAPNCNEQLKNEYGNRYYATPKKMAAQTEEANINAGLAAARQIVNYLEKGDRTFQVN
ncbi:MAG: 3-phosphoglycerate dehydrogenase [Bacteroidales bacterium]|nr:3-phosphoglycerate dehydrogenase [Bacteroidales bacterium]